MTHLNLIRDIEKMAATTKNLTEDIKTNSISENYLNLITDFINQFKPHSDRNLNLYKLRESIQDLEHSLINLFSEIEYSEDIDMISNPFARTVELFKN
tara:strand:- start:11 stop:304 length:294 start_codon:yes stop_codon:yes gene_type:complete